MTKLSCNSCGAKLELTDNIDRFSCAHCGAEWIVNRSGGIVSLKAVEEGIGKIAESTQEIVQELKSAKTYEAIVNEEALRHNARAEIFAEVAEQVREDEKREEEEATKNVSQAGCIVFLILIGLPILIAIIWNSIQGLLGKH
jgi:hypothetical protein